MTSFLLTTPPQCERKTRGAYYVGKDLRFIISNLF